MGEGATPGAVNEEPAAAGTAAALSSEDIAAEQMWGSPIEAN
jgi:hypothetical protein